jgi:transposase-like protein
MTTENTDFPKTLLEASRYFADKDRALDFLVGMRWPDGVVCPYCNSRNVAFRKAKRVWRCKDCEDRREFSVKVGTIMEDSPIPLDKWLVGMWLIVSAKNGISSYELHRALGITQKSAWFLGHRIRFALQNGSLVSMGNGVVCEVDETFIGGKARNMHFGKRQVKGTGPIAMTPVMGLLERGTAKRHSRVKVAVVATRRKAELQGHVRKYVLKGAEVCTDALASYNGLADNYTHSVIDHAERYVDGHIHTNGLENFWSLLKRCIKGTHVSIEPFHLFRYLDEESFRFNERKDKRGDQGRFLTGMQGIAGRRLTYNRLTGKENFD